MNYQAYFNQSHSAGGPSRPALPYHAQSAMTFNPTDRNSLDHFQRLKRGGVRELAGRMPQPPAYQPAQNALPSFGMGGFNQQPFAGAGHMPYGFVRDEESANRRRPFGMGFGMGQQSFMQPPSRNSLPWWMQYQPRPQQQQPVAFDLR